MKNYPIKQVHLGLGQFFRGHQAYYTELAKEDWGIAAVSMRTDTAVKQMQAQKNRYSVLARDHAVAELTQIHCVAQSYFLPESYQAVFDLLASEQTEIISLTVTEKGYCFDFHKGELDLNLTEIQAELKSDKATTAIGLIAHAMEQRYKTHQKPGTLLSCDNVSFNGSILKKAVASFLKAKESPCLEWFEKEVMSPNTMVDRIIPKTTEEEKKKAFEDKDDFDPLVILTEKFSQWCIEDKFSSEKPHWPGVQLVQNIEPFENLKLRALNGAHSYLTYMGRLKNYETVDEAIQDQEILDDLSHLFTEEVYPTLKPDISETEYKAYTEALIQRFKNPHLKHRLEQIAMDGTQKVPQRWLPVIKENKEQCPILVKALCVWILFLKRKLDQNEKIMDPKAEQIKSWNDKDIQTFAQQFQQIIPAEILGQKSFKRELDEQYQRFF
ncbi:MAG: hypothetical protein CME62_15610 [Halobacteriovoraceae bacterium]|nr:hypothetical protein [Halobacteriovoraceae bacterium]|tara:strand:+ start:773 stop:2092 length:1320 start_codon:yes stop_codon:yes gene_type:complete